MKKYVAFMLASALCLSLMTGCGDKTQKEPEATGSDLVVVAQQQAEDEYAAYMAEILKTNVMADRGEMKKMNNIVENFYDVETEALSDMAAWEHIPSAEEQIAGDAYTYIFLAKLGPDAEGSTICSQLLSSGSKLEGVDNDDMEVNVAASGGYVIFAAAPNGADIQAKFTLVIGNGEYETTADIFRQLSVDLSK